LDDFTTITKALFGLGFNKWKEIINLECQSSLKIKQRNWKIFLQINLLLVANGFKNENTMLMALHHTLRLIQKLFVDTFTSIVKTTNLQVLIALATMYGNLHYCLNT
jgi:hypothetical protein